MNGADGCRAAILRAKAFGVLATRLGKDFIETRRNLDNARAASVQRYLTAQTAGRPMNFEVVVHDPMPVGEHADPANRSVRLNHTSTAGTLAGGASATTASSTGASAGGGGPGAAATGGAGATPAAPGGGQPTGR